MKIYYVANARMPSERAHAIQIAKMSEALAIMGVEVVLVCPRRSFSETTPAQFYGLKRDLRVIYLPVLPLYGKSKLGFWLGTFSFIFSYLFFLWSRYFAGERVLAYSIDMDQFSPAGMLFSPFPFFIELHDAKPFGLIFGAVLKKARGIVTINSIIRDKLCVRFSLPIERILVVPNGIDLAKFQAPVGRDTARERLGLESKKQIVMYTGQLYGWKGLGQLIEFAHHVRDAYLYIVGGTKEELLKLEPRAFLPDNLVCVSKRPYEEIPFWLQAADVLVVLGTRDNEYSYYHTSPMKLFEYLATGVPILAADTPAIREVVNDKEVWFHKPDDALDMVSVFKKITSQNEQGIEEKSRAAKTRAEGYSWEKRAEKVIKFITCRGLP